MKKKNYLSGLLVALTMLGNPLSCWAQTNGSEKTVYDFTVENQKHQKVSLSEYKGKVLLIVNTASHCGFTSQYDELQQLYYANRDKGFVVLDFPCNQFGQQAPENDAEYNGFCRQHFSIEFPQFHKIDVNGENAIPLFQWLKSQQGFQGFDPTHKLSSVLDNMLRKGDPHYASNPDIKWNFTKFLIDRKGRVVKRFEPTANHDLIVKAVEECLAQNP